MSFRIAGVTAVLVQLVLVPVEALGQSRGSSEPTRVLALYWNARDHPANVIFDQHLRAALDADAQGSVEYYPEYLESNRFPGAGQAVALRDYLRKKYADRRIDVILSVWRVPLQFLLTHRPALFPDTPIVFYTAGAAGPAIRSARPAVTGVSSPGAYRRTVELALRLHPDATRVFVISGTPDRDKIAEGQVREQLGDLDGRVAVTYLTDLPLHELIATVKDLPERSVILYVRQSHDQPGRVLRPEDFLHLVFRSARVPIYSLGKWYLGSGIVGGYMVDLETGARKSAEAALQVARGTRPEDLPIVEVPPIAMFDARQLSRWQIPEGRLPPDRIVLFREPTVWERYAGFLVATGLVILAQTALIGALLLQRARRRRAEASLWQSEQRYELATAAGRVGVWDWNLLTNEIFVDPALKRMLGFADHEIANHIDSWVSRMHPDDAGLLRREAYLDGGRTTYEVEHRMLHRDGSIRWFLARGSAVRLPDGRAVRIVGTDTDITKRKATEARLQATQDELARVSRLTALGELAASIAHEISQPLSAILMNARACLRWLGSSTPPLEEIRAALLDVAEAGTRAKELMHRNRELFQNHTVEKLLLNVNSVVRDVALLARTRLQNSQIALRLTLDDGLPAVFGDRVELQQVILNLVLNAIDAMETVDPHLREIQIESRLTGEGMVRITVRDHGIGLEGVDEGRMFTPTYTTKPSGMGVGLSISRSIVEAHGGALRAEPTDGPGATFCVTLPAAAAGIVAPDAATAAHPEVDTRTDPGAAA